MATLKILTSENEILRKISKPVKLFDDNLVDFIDDMSQTLKTTTGVGLAAPQVGVLKRVIVVDLNGIHFEMVNPKIISCSGSQTGDEGCLSVPNVHKKVTRPNKVTIKGFDKYGNEFSVTGSDYLARCMCHEVDHLDGILFIDKVK